MIRQVKVTNHLGETVTLDMRHPDQEGIFIARIEGLGPPTATININDVSTGDGGVYNSSRLEPRNIVMTLGFLHNRYSVEEIRLKTYKFFPIKRKVKITILTDKRQLEAIGYVETNEPDIFVSQGATQISILCPDPYLYSTAVSNTIFSGVEPMFEFPFSNESLTENLLIMSEIRIEQEQTVLYPGDIDIGIQIHIHAVGPASGITIHNITTREQMTIDSTKLIAITGSDIVYGDDILITTTRFNESIYLLRDGEYFDILNTLGRNTDWFKISTGDNIFVYTAEENPTNLQFRISNRIAYEGI